MQIKQKTGKLSIVLYKHYVYRISHFTKNLLSVKTLMILALIIRDERADFLSDTLNRPKLIGQVSVFAQVLYYILYYIKFAKSLFHEKFTKGTNKRVQGFFS